jgi:hypothetical protein
MDVSSLLTTTTMTTTSDQPKTMTAISTEHKTPSSYAFLNRPFLRWSRSGSQGKGRMRGQLFLSSGKKRLGTLRNVTDRFLSFCNHHHLLVSILLCITRAGREKGRRGGGQGGPPPLDDDDKGQQRPQRLTHSDWLNFDLTATHGFLEL